VTRGISAVKYYRNFQNDSKFVKAVVGICFGLDIIATVVNNFGGMAFHHDSDGFDEDSVVA
jgi:hypothetical protein